MNNDFMKNLYHRNLRHTVKQYFCTLFDYIEYVFAGSFIVLWPEIFSKVSTAVISWLDFTMNSQRKSDHIKWESAVNIIYINL